MTIYSSEIEFSNKMLLMLILILFCSCNVENTKSSDNERSKKSLTITNLESDSPVVWHIHDELYCYMYWIGNYRTLVDTVVTFDPLTYDETLHILNQTIREGNWYLKDCENKIYAEFVYQNDSLISIKRLSPYKRSYEEMSKIGNFESPKLVRKEIDYY